MFRVRRPDIDRFEAAYYPKDDPTWMECLLWHGWMAGDPFTIYFAPWEWSFRSLEDPERKNIAQSATPWCFV